MEFEHISVLPEEVIAGLAIKPDGIYVDCTLGGAGHSSRIASQLNENGHLIGIDQDEDAIKVATERLKQYQCKIDIVHSNFKNLEAILNDLNIEYIDGILFDLGVSSYQLDEADRGFLICKMHHLICAWIKHKIFLHIMWLMNMMRNN